MPFEAAVNLINALGGREKDEEFGKLNPVFLVLFINLMLFE